MDRFLKDSASHSHIINTAASRLIVCKDLPLNHFDDNLVREFVDVVAEVARTTQGHVRVSSLIHRRQSMTDKWVPEYRRQLFERACAKLIPIAQHVGCTLSQVCDTVTADNYYLTSTYVTLT